MKKILRFCMLDWCVIPACLLFADGAWSQVFTQTFTYTGALETWTVPACASTMTIEARGARGGYNGGLGARMIGTFTTTGGQVLKIIVGGQGLPGANDVGNGGGGGSFVTLINNTPLCIAGGGGGTGHGSAGQNYAGIQGVTTTSGQIGQSANAGAGGVNGNGGFESYTTQNIPNGGGGGGLLTNGGSAGAAIGGSAFVNGGQGGTSTGGFGGGGGSNVFIYGCGSSPHGGSGGGGYSGGGGGGSNCNGAGGGGGSYNGGTNQSNTAGFQSGNGLVVISYALNGNSVTAAASNTSICNGSSSTLSANGMVSYTWNTGAQTSSIVVNPNVTTSYTVVGTNSLNCISTSILTVTVNTGVPVLSVSSSTNFTCYGKTVTLTASGALTYTWSHGVVNGVAYTPSITNTYTVSGGNGCGTTTAVTSVTVAPIPVSTSATPTITCAGSTSSLSAVAAATSYTWLPANLYQANIIVNPATTTIYTVTVSDGTCSGTGHVTLTVLPIPTISAVSSATSVCAGNPVSLSASGGLSYTWMPGNLSGPTVTVSPTAPTLYTVTGDNSVGCKSSTTQIVLTEVSPVVNVSGSGSAVCAGDPVILVASGNASGYMWTNGPNTTTYNVNPLVTTVYTVTGTSSQNTCTTTKTIAVTVFDPTLNVSASSPSVCSGGTIALMASGGDTYSWDNGVTSPVNTVTPSANSTHTVISMTTSGNLTCGKTATISLTVHQNPAIVATSNRTLICKDESTVLNASGGTSYNWSTGATLASVQVVPQGITIHSYTVTGSDGNGCISKATILVRVIACSGIAETAPGSVNVEIYPNPVTDEFTVKSDTPVVLTLNNELGQEVMKIPLTSDNEFSYKVNSLPGGIYLLKPSGSVGQAKKIVILR